jgi:hypothetical protein
MSFKSLLDAWSAEQEPVKTRETYNINLDVDDAAKVHAFAEMFPGVDRERIITDLLSKALDQLEAAIPYQPGDNVIREDDQGDPIYEDVGLTPRFLKLVKKHRESLD